jgi:hypothetical protein
MNAHEINADRYHDEFSSGNKLSAPSPTPRTDDNVWLYMHIGCSKDEVVFADFARTLETELAVAQERVRELEATDDKRCEVMVRYGTELAAARAENAKLRGLLRGGATLIAQERQRQVSAEGWDAGHDDEHDEDEMAQAAACYCLQSDRNWPWNLEWWKPCPQNRIKELIKAGALIAAEIDRLIRAELNKEATT